MQRKSVYTHFDVCFESIFGSANTSGIALALKTGVPSYQVQDEEGRIHLLIDLPIEGGEHRWRLWRPDHADFDSRSIFDGALVDG